MEEASTVCVPPTSNGEHRISEAVQSCLNVARRLLSSVPRQTTSSISNELTSVSNHVIAEFKLLVSLLDSTSPPFRRTVRRGPLLSSLGIDKAELLDCRDSESRRLLNCSSEANFAAMKSSSFPLHVGFDHAASIPPQPSRLCLGLNLWRYQPSLSAQASHYMSESVLSSKMKQYVSEGGSASTEACHCSKKRKLRVRRTVRVPANSSKTAEMPCDDFSWRKYGQKPIKGSPYPRSYYKCSSMRECPARKHVERCLEDANMMVVTYEGDHIHSRIPLATKGIVLSK